eukprot:579448-Alexandrium_andersonii.AAC.1
MKATVNGANAILNQLSQLFLFNLGGPAPPDLNLHSHAHAPQHSAEPSGWRLALTAGLRGFAVLSSN